MSGTSPIDHIARHDVLPEKAEQVVQNEPLDISRQMRKGERRTVQLGSTNAGRILFVVVTERKGKLRVVTAYPANRRARAFYVNEAGK